MNRFLVGGLCAMGLLCAGGWGAEARPRQGQRPAEVRLIQAGAEARTKARREAWSEVRPGQALPSRTLFDTGSDGAELDLGAAGRLQLGPGTRVALAGRPGRRSAGSLRLLRGTIWIELAESAGSFTVRTARGRARVTGTAHMEASDGELAVAVYAGRAAVRGPGGEVELTGGQGVRVSRAARPQARPLPPAPAWEEGAAQLLVARGALGDGPLDVQAVLPFRDAPGVERYRVDLARDPRFNQVRVHAEVGYPPFRTRLPPGLHHLRVSAVGPERLPGPPSPPLTLRVVTVRSDAAVDADGRDSQVALHLRREQTATVEVSGGGLPLLARLDGGPEVDCRAGHRFALGPGSHRIHLAADAARAEVRVAVAAPPAPPPAPRPRPAVAGPAPVGLPVPLTTPGFPGRGLHPRTRAFALLGIGSSGPGRPADGYRLDLGGEVAFLRNNFSVDLDLPVLYQRTDETGAFALGDLQLGFRAVALRLLGGQIALGPLLRLQLPTGTFQRPDEPGGHPVILDPAVALAAVAGPVGLLTTQGPTAVLAVQAPALRWSMTYVAELRLGWLGVLGELDAALGMGGASSGAALGGALRAQLPGASAPAGRWSLLLGARGGLGEQSAALFGRYQVSAGVEWRLR